jgi:hypothetical protein
MCQKCHHCSRPSPPSKQPWCQREVIVPTTNRSIAVTNPLAGRLTKRRPPVALLPAWSTVGEHDYATPVGRIVGDAGVVERANVGVAAIGKQTLWSSERVLPRPIRVNTARTRRSIQCRVEISRFSGGGEALSSCRSRLQDFRSLVEWNRLSQTLWLIAQNEALSGMYPVHG